MSVNLESKLWCPQFAFEIVWPLTLPNLGDCVVGHTNFLIPNCLHNGILTIIRQNQLLFPPEFFFNNMNRILLILWETRNLIRKAADFTYWPSYLLLPRHTTPFPMIVYFQLPALWKDHVDDIIWFNSFWIEAKKMKNWPDNW